MSDSVRPHRQQPTRLPRPGDSPGKNTGVGCHFLLQCMKVKVKSLSHVRLLATPWTTAYQAPPSMGFSRQEYWSGVPLPYTYTKFNDIWFLMWFSGKQSACQYRSYRRCCFNPWVWKIPWRRKWKPIPVFLPGKSHGHVVTKSQTQLSD